jgi:hypothetical protein
MLALALHLSVVVQVVEDGYEFFAKRQLVTLFSAPNYCGEFDNAGAMMSVDDTLMCSFQVRRRSHAVVVCVFCFAAMRHCALIAVPRRHCTLTTVPHRPRVARARAQILKPADQKSRFAYRGGAMGGGGAGGGR